MSKGVNKVFLLGATSWVVTAMRQRSMNLHLLPEMRRRPFWGIIGPARADRLPGGRVQHLIPQEPYLNSMCACRRITRTLQTQSPYMGMGGNYARDAHSHPLKSNGSRARVRTHVFRPNHVRTPGSGTAGCIVSGNYRVVYWQI